MYRSLNGTKNVDIGIDIGIVHFERTHCLEQTLKSLDLLVSCLQNLGLLNQLILCDDSWREKTIDKVKSLCTEYGYSHKYTGGQKGLSFNNNLLLEESKGSCLLHLQDDFVFLGEYINDFINLIKEFFHNDETCMLRLFNVNEASNVFEYSDTPHLKKRVFHQTIGSYPNQLPMHKAELLMKKKSKEYFSKHQVAYSRVSYFTHIGEEYSFNPSNIRDARLRKIGLLKVYNYASKVIKKCLRY